MFAHTTTNNGSLELVWFARRRQVRHMTVRPRRVMWTDANIVHAYPVALGWNWKAYVRQESEDISMQGPLIAYGWALTLNKALSAGARARRRRRK